MPNCTPEGAAKLARQIKAYWRERGHMVDVELIPQGHTNAMRGARVDIRSDMINGLPRKGGSNG